MNAVKENDIDIIINVFQSNRRLYKQADIKGIHYIICIYTYAYLFIYLNKYLESKGLFKFINVIARSLVLCRFRII